ncbi:TPA: hypothetical protein PTV74_003251 [Clostridium botulinum]|nr:hypothetical protein [Clostridium botulinum]HDK7206405.1 hypothetical protein [Clostridium botulinum]HDK7210141.1 hypothetical protein [Clostridium botulinum]HDK7265590.1 hypothetical protein [Clostridium botulinum]HDK7269438.1 hypothetical protein [Clostridium botulinum]
MYNKSIKYIKNRIKQSVDGIGDIPLDNWDEANIINPMILFKNDFNIPIKDNRIDFELIINNDKRTKAIIEYNNEADYNYFTSNFVTHDGTLLFQIQAIDEMLNKFFYLKTCYKKVATDDFMNNPFNYDVKYTIGDVLINSNYGINKINGNNMRGQKDSIVLPVKFEIFKHEII